MNSPNHLPYTPEASVPYFLIVTFVALACMETLVALVYKADPNSFWLLPDRDLRCFGLRKFLSRSGVGLLVRERVLSRFGEMTLFSLKLILREEFLLSSSLFSTPAP
eukprot:TRINITY_DN8216_c0_g1_i1.p1 TRINITY_DN8216_c0_g1~~TRINITY_DN8216_c0_g1_i1.p1  ORF type:complete len:107 (-),score=2.12 TRINITY_DN8216_c0_g1_i1:95-415(-)